MMRHWREREFERHLSPATCAPGPRRCGRSSPRGRGSISFATGLAMRVLGNLGTARGRFRRLPLAGGWTKHRDLPAPAGQTFQEMWAERQRQARMSARDAILAQDPPLARRHRRGAGAQRRRGRPAAQRAARRHPGARPAAAEPNGVALFATMAEKVSATVARVADADDVPAAVADYLRAHNLPAAVRIGDDPRLAALPWEQDARSRSRTGRPTASDPVGISHAFAGVAETGTLVLTSGRDNPTTLNFLPETHIVVVERRRRRRRLRDGVGPRCASATARAPCRARSTASPARRAPATSSRRSCSAPTGRGACTSSSSVSGSAPPRRARAPGRSRRPSRHAARRPRMPLRPVGGVAAITSAKSAFQRSTSARSASKWNWMP